MGKEKKLVHWTDIAANNIIREKGDKKKSAQYTLYRCLLTILKMFAPIIPFVTEEIYQEYFRKNEKTKSIHLMEWPKYDKKISPSEISENPENIVENLKTSKISNPEFSWNSSKRLSLVLCLFSSKRKLRSSSLSKLKCVIGDVLRYIYRKSVGDVVALPKEVFIRARAHGGSMRTLLNYKIIRLAFEKLGIIQSLGVTIPSRPPARPPNGYEYTKSN